MTHEIIIRVDDEKNETRVSQGSNPWMDLAIVAEGLATIIPLAARYKEKTFNEILEYTKNYLDKAARGYETHIEKHEL